jgi:hypothetical protein
MLGAPVALAILTGLEVGPKGGWAALGRVGTFFIGAFGDIDVDIFPKIGG